jgi:hypothetical protein
MRIKQRNALGDLIGAEGIKADVTINIDTASLVYMSIAVFVAVMAANVASHFILKAISK